MTPNHITTNPSPVGVGYLGRGAADKLIEAVDLSLS